MRLSTLLSEIEQSRGPITGIDLANRLGVRPAEVASMLVALRASGHLGPEIRTEPAPENCTSTGSCSMTCPGPDACSLVIDLNVTGLEIVNSQSEWELT
jgi:hypothetical protein